MAFLVFECDQSRPQARLRPTGGAFKLAGYNLLYKAWTERGKPLDAGWKVSANELIRLLTNSAESYETRRLLIDFDPNAKWRIGLIEILDVFAYSYRDSSGDVGWTPIMLRLRDVFYDEFSDPMTHWRTKKRQAFLQACLILQPRTRILSSSCI